MVNQSGITTDGKIVVSGIYRFHETRGLPLEVILAKLHENNIVIDWESFLRESLDAGMKKERALSKLRYAMADTFAPHYIDAVMSRLSAI